jgi:serine/threonine protein kinase
MNLQNYTIKSEIGRGGMATVYLAHDNKFDTNVAVKVLNKEFVNNENIRKRFISEARNMYKMSHPNIIKVTDLIEEGDTVAFVMEYIEGQTLKEYLDRKRKLNDAEIKNMFSQMLDAVGYVHEQNLVHRDIKPSNFMLDKKGNIKLMDFGIAKNMDVTSSDYTHTGTNQNMGTPMYMSPEQIKSTKDVTLQSDIYSLGVVLWQMVMGKKPYDTKTISIFELQNKIVTENLSLTNSKFDFLIEVATAKELNIRYNNCKEFKTKLDNLNKEVTGITNLNNSENSEKTIFDNFKATEIYHEKPIIETNNQQKEFSKGKKSNKSIFIGIGAIILAVIGYFLFSYYKNVRLEDAINNFNNEEYSIAYNIFNSSILKDNSEAQYYLGKMYSLGYYVNKDYDKAFLLAKTSSEQGNDKGLNMIGAMYENGWGTSKDINKAIEMYTKAAKLGNAKAYSNLGDIYYNGIEEIEIDYSKAIEYYMSAINFATGQMNKDLSAKPECRIGLIYLNGGYGVEANFNKAKEYFLIAIEKNNSDAAVYLGFMYENGKGVSQDYNLAFKYYTISANLSNPLGQSNLGSFYLSGKGCTQNDIKALELFKKSANQGNSYGLANLGYMYEFNRGGAGYDISKAIMYYKQAADLGNEWAKSRLAN